MRDSRWPAGTSVAIRVLVLILCTILGVSSVALCACGDGRETAADVLSQTLQNSWPGDTLVMGAYAGEPLEWRVLARDETNGRTLLITEYVVEDIAYQEGGGSTTWAACTLRTWLNGDFILDTFSADEQRFLTETMLVTADNPTYHTQGGTVAYDRVFCLSVEELQQYFLCMPERQTPATAHALEAGVSEFSGGAHWWSRSPGRHQDNIAYVTPGGNIDLFGINVGREDYMGVRPAMWVLWKPAE